MKDVDEDEILWQKLNEFTKPKNKKEIVVIRQWNWLAKRSGIFKKASTRIELPSGKTEFGKTINNNPEKYFTDDVMERLETVVEQYFKYGNTNRTDDTQESDSE